MIEQEKEGADAAVIVHIVNGPRGEGGMEPLPGPGIIVDIRMILCHIHMYPEPYDLFYDRPTGFFETRIPDGPLGRGKHYHGICRFLLFPAMSHMSRLPPGLPACLFPSVHDLFMVWRPGRRKGRILIAAVQLCQEPGVLPFRFFQGRSGFLVPAPPFRCLFQCLIALTFRFQGTLLHGAYLFPLRGEFLLMLFFHLLENVEPLVAD